MMSEHTADTRTAARRDEVKHTPTGVELIAAERRRQVKREGYTPEHDDEHDGGALALAAACYATPVRLYERQDNQNGVEFTDPWPWESCDDKRPRSEKNGQLLHNYYCHTIVDVYAQTKGERVRQLVKAGALIAAEIDRLQRAEGDQS